MDIFIDWFAELSCDIIPVINEFKGGRPISTQSGVLIYWKIIHLKILEIIFFFGYGILSLSFWANLSTF